MPSHVQASGAREFIGLRRRCTGRGRTSVTRAGHHFKHAFKGRLTRADTDRRCTTLGRLARISIGGRAPFASLGDEAAQQRDGAAGTRPCLVHTDVGRLTRLTTVLRRSQSEQSRPDGIASLSPARTGLDQRADVKMAGSTVGRTVVPRGITSSSAGELRI
jgi:hypothetical protein